MDNNVQDVNYWGVDSSAKAMSVHELFGEDIQYMIPLYQRNYDWTTVNVLQLLEDVRDKAITAPENNYYIGTLVVYPRREYGRVVYEVIDGQQRLTTLTLLLNAIKQHVDVSNCSTIRLSYEHREQANEVLFNLSKSSSDDGCVKSIEENFRFLKNKIEYWNEPIELNAFVQYLLHHVMIARVEVPQGTDLNHYFEIMNTRGEQLEMHEVLKARLMSPLKDDDTSEGNNSSGVLKRHLFNVLWEACSDMNNYVQMNFRGELLALRKELFGEYYDKMPTKSFDDLLQVFKQYSEDEAKCINDFLKGNATNAIEDNDEKQDNRKQSYGSLLSFPSFLLHVLKVMLHQKDGNTVKVTLDDKTLISAFGQVKFDEALSKEFIMSLVKIRFLFDKYIIKREYIGEDKEDWSLERLEYDGNNVSYVRTFNKKEDDSEEIEGFTEDIRMLQSMFQVSFPTQNYKHWVYAILNKVYVDASTKDSIKGDEMRNWLYRMACAYMLDGYLKQTDGLSIESITNQDDWVIPSDVTLDFDKINRGCAVENYVFNFYDYVIWKYGEEINAERIKDIDLNNFKFTYRSSVEHFYPQHPIDNNPPVDNVDDFGNLCLISSSMNSRFNNLMPASKYDSFGNKNDGVRRLSLKLNQMFKIIEEKKKWDEESIKEFGDYARNVLREGIKRGGDQQNNN